MHRRTIVVGLLACLAITLLAVLTLHQPARQSASREPDTPSDAHSAVDSAPTATVAATAERDPQDARAATVTAQSEPAAAVSPSTSASAEPSVVVVVVDTSDAPISGATVSITGEGPIGSHTADAAGRCPLPIEPGDGSVQLRVEKEGFVPFQVRYSRGPEIRLTLHRALTIRGRCVDAATQAAIAGAMVRATGTGTPGLDPQTVCDATGKFELRGIPDGQAATFMARAEGFATNRREVAFRSSDSELVFELQRGVELRFVVIDSSSRQPIAGASVSRDKDEYVSDATGSIATSGLFAPSEPLTRVSATAPGYCVLGAVIRASDAARAEPIELPLLRSARVEGTARGSEGVVLADLTINLDYDYAFGSSSQPADVSYLDLPEGWSISSANRNLRAVTDANGHFEFDGLQPGSKRFRLGASMPGRGGRWIPIEVVGAPATTTHVDVVLDAKPKGGVITGRVTLNGEPCRASVQWKGSSREGVGSTKADGTFRLEDVETGEVAVSARLRSMDMSERCGQLLANSSTVHVDTESEATLDIELTLPTSRIAGRVLRADGSAAEKASVSAWSREACLHASATTDSDGRFDMVVDDAAITFRVEAGEGVEQMAIDAVAPGTTNLEIKLGQRARLKLRVVDRDTRAPITQFHLVLQAAGRREQQFDTNMRMSAEPFALDPDGWCSLTIPADAYEVLVFDPPRVESGYQFASVPNVRVAANEETVVEVEREKGLEVVLQLAEGETAWSRKDTVVVFLQSRWWPDVDYGRNGMRWTFEVPRSEGRHIYFVNLDDVGRAAFKGLAPGTYRFKTGGVSLKIEPEQFVVPADGPVLLHLTRE